MIMHLAALPRNRAIEIGSKTYVDPWECKRGHFTHKLVSRRVCYECSRASSRDHMRRKYADPDYRNQLVDSRRKRYQEDESHRSKILEDQKLAYAKDPEKIKSRVRRYAKANPDKIYKGYRKHYEANKERLIQYQRDYALANPEKISAWGSKSRARRKERMIQTSDELDELNQLCMEEAYLTASDRSELFGFDWHVDHMIPMQAREASGLHLYTNIQVIPADLNQWKHNKMIYTNDLEWLADAVEPPA